MTLPPILLFIGIDAVFRNEMKTALACDYQALEASDRANAILKMRQAMPPLVLLDLSLPSVTNGTSEGLETLSETLQRNPVAKVIAVTGKGDRATAIAAFENGAYDVIEKPVQLD